MAFVRHRQVDDGQHHENESLQRNDQDVEYGPADAQQRAENRADQPRRRPQPQEHHSDDNPDGGLDDATIKSFQTGVTTDRIAFLDEFTTTFYKAGRKQTVSDAQIAYARQIAYFASPKATLDCITAFGETDFRDDLAKISIPTLVIHGDSDAIVPYEVSGKRTAATLGSSLTVIKDGPHGINVSHPTEFNEALLTFLNS